MKQKLFKLKRIKHPVITFFAIIFLFYIICSENPFTTFMAAAIIIVPVIFIVSSVLKNSDKEEYLNYDITIVNQMSGVEFENFLMYHFRAKGYCVETTPKTSDFGADLILRKHGIKTVVQAKRYSGNVGVKAIQEIIAAKQFYHADKAIVATNSVFTKNAKRLAQCSDVRLIDHNGLIEFMSCNNSTICPKCGSYLTIKREDNVDYYCCSNYSKCQFKRKIE